LFSLHSGISLSLERSSVLRVGRGAHQRGRAGGGVTQGRAKFAVVSSTGGKVWAFLALETVATTLVQSDIQGATKKPS
jgi:hypothetical protein